MSHFKAGFANLPIWEFPTLVPKKRLTDVDSLSGTYFTPRTTVLNPGDAVPGYPGMIIMDLSSIDSGQSLKYSIQAEGSLDNTSPTKTLSRSEVRSIGPNFETISERKLSWQTARKACTGVASTDIITATEGPHGFANGQRLCFLSLTGGAGLQAQTLSVIATVYFAISATSTTFQVSTTSGGSAVNFTTDISAGYFMAAEFFPGTPHPLSPAMYLTAVNASDNMTPWRNADCSYVGKMWDKPYHRVVTVNGQQISSTTQVTLSGVGDGDSDLHYRVAELPEIVVTDTHIDANGLPTASVPSSHSEGGTPPNPPSVRSLTISSDNDDDLVYQWPNQWSFIGTNHIETINSGIALTIYAKVYKFKWPVLLR
jgi:hypothetical protein